MKTEVTMTIEFVPHVSPTKLLEELIRKDAKLVHCLQECPYTAVGMTYLYDGNSFTGVGFSKVNWPDKWDHEYGFDVAVSRAVRSIRKQIQKYEEIKREYEA